MHGRILIVRGAKWFVILVESMVSFRRCIVYVNQVFTWWVMAQKVSAMERKVFAGRELQGVDLNLN